MATAAALSGCAAPAAPDTSWSDEEHLTVPVRWIRTHEPAQFEVRAGVCILYMADTEDGRDFAGRLVHGCLAAGGLRAGAGDFDLHWHRVDGQPQIWQRYVSIYGPPPAPMPSLAIKPGLRTTVPAAMRHNLLGFYARREDLTGPCRVVTLRDRTALGHELKHCYDGRWHP